MSAEIQSCQYHDYAGMFSRSVFTEVLKYGDCSSFDRMIDMYGNRSCSSYLDYLSYLYKEISKHYRCEYVFKNELIKKAIAKHFRRNDTVAFNEFRAGDSIVDIALFNGESRAFEIKTEYDSTKRLNKQLKDYSCIFQRCYVVVPSEAKEFYESYLDENIGIVLLSRVRGKIRLWEYKEAKKNESIDVHVLMSALRTQEYKNIVCNCYGNIPNVSCFEMYKACEALLEEIPAERLASEFIAQVKRRKGTVNELDQYPECLRQMCLSMNLKHEDVDNIIKILSKPITF